MTVTSKLVGAVVLFKEDFTHELEFNLTHGGFVIINDIPATIRFEGCLYEGVGAVIDIFTILMLSSDDRHMWVRIAPSLFTDFRNDIMAQHGRALEELVEARAREHGYIIPQPQ